MGFSQIVSNPILPKHLEDQVFVKELVEIGAVDMSEDGLAEIADYTRLCLTLEFQLNDWYEDGRIIMVPAIQTTAMQKNVNMV